MQDSLDPCVVRRHFTVKSSVFEIKTDIESVLACEWAGTLRRSVLVIIVEVVVVIVVPVVIVVAVAVVAVARAAGGPVIVAVVSAPLSGLVTGRTGG